MKNGLKNLTIALIFLSLFTVAVVPSAKFVFAQDKAPVDLSSKGGGLVPDCPPEGCGFVQLLELVKTIINFLLFTLSIPIAAIIFAYAGFKFMTSGGNEGERSKAKSMLWNVLIGLVIALAAWLIVNTIVNALLKPGYSLLG